MPSDVTYSVSRDSNCSLWMVNGKILVAQIKNVMNTKQI